MSDVFLKQTESTEAPQDLPHIKNNLLNLWRNVLGCKGWEILEDLNLLCLKSPATVPNLNICWGIDSSEALEAARLFFDGRTFGYIVEDVEKQCTFKVPSINKSRIVEMILTETNHSQHKTSSFPIKRVQSNADIDVWAELSNQIFGLSIEDAQTFLHPIATVPGASFFIAIKEDSPIGIGHIYIDQNGLAGLSSIGVLEQYRRQGIGRDIMGYCIDYCLSHNAQFVTLHASELGLKLYETLNFKPIRHSEFLIIAGE